MSIDTLIDDQLHRYILEHSLRLTDEQQALFDKAKDDELSQMNTSPEQVQFLSLLMKMLNVKTALEIGVFRGFGTLSMALALPEDGKIIACDITEEHLKNYKTYWHKAGVDHKIELKINPANISLEQLIEQGFNQSLDFAYIDADKESYPEYYEYILQLLKPGGVMIFDNMLWKGGVADPENQQPSTVSIRQLNEIIHHDNRVQASLLPVGDGINIVRKK